MIKVLLNQTGVGVGWLETKKGRMKNVIAGPEYDINLARTICVWTERMKMTLIWGN